MKLSETDLTSPDAMEYDLPFLRGKLIEKYEEIEKKGISVISQGLAVENPVETVKKIDSRYSIAAIGLVSDPLDFFLSQAIARLKQLEPKARYAEDGFRHITFREVAYNDRGRKKAEISTGRVMDYYKALRMGSFADEPVKVELYKILAAIDREQPSVSIIAGLLPVDLNIIAVRQSINSEVSKAQLSLVGRLGNIPSVHVTLARMPYPPQVDEGRVPLLDLIKEINDSIPSGCLTDITQIDVISTTRISYPWNDKHVYIWPPVSLIGQQSQDPIGYLRPNQRRIKEDGIIDR